jgi:hypothetical protein
VEFVQLTDGVRLCTWTMQRLQADINELRKHCTRRISRSVTGA